MADKRHDINSKSITPEKADLLLYGLNNGIINLDSVRDDYMASKKEQALKMHPYSITPPSENNPRWQTYYRDRDGKRKLLRAQTKEELIEKLIPAYFPEALADKMVFDRLFYEWLDYRKEVSSSPNTPMRHKQRYLKYLKPSVLSSQTLNHISELMLERECNKIVKTYNLSSKEWVNVKTILTGMFKYAIRRGYIKHNPMEKVEISVKFRQIVRKTGQTQTYNTEECKAINEYLEAKYEETKDLSFLAIMANFCMGLRIGELAALKWEDIGEKHVHVVREEVRDQTTNEVYVAEHTKTNTDRFVALIPKAKEIFDRIEHTDEFIFTRDGKRLTSRQLNYVLEKYAERTNRKTKSSHKIRKTYASMLNANNVPIDAIRIQLGHTNLSTTYNYLFNPLTEKETYKLIAESL